MFCSFVVDAFPFRSFAVDDFPFRSVVVDAFAVIPDCDAIFFFN